MSHFPTRISSLLTYPRQKLSDTKKNDDWYKSNIDYAENLLTTDHSLRSTQSNKKINYDMRANIINIKDFERFINPDKLDLKSLPASFQHIGIENSKINLLLGEYDKRKKEYRAFLSANDQEGISRKEKTLMNQMNQMVTNIIIGSSTSEEEIKQQLEEFDKYSRYDFQDVAEITANKILKREYKEQNLDFLFLRTFEDLLTAGEQIVYCSVLGGEPVMRRVDTRKLYTLGGNSMYIEDRDIIIEYDYMSIGQVIDDYWDELTEKDIEFLETGNYTSDSSRALGLNRDISIYDYYGEDDTAIQIFKPNDLGVSTFGGGFDHYGNVRVVRACWRSRRKIGKRKYFDEDGQEQFDFVDEHYIPRKDLGEDVKWMWVNEWLESTKIGDHIYVNMRPVPFAGKSLTNKSKGTPPYIGTIYSTNGYKVQSLMDVMKPLAISYDIAYYKRELAIATYKGSFAAINSSMVPSGWEPDEWIRYVTISGFGFLDPTNEILKGPSQGKSAGAFNTVTASNVRIGDPEVIQILTNILLDIENTLGKLAGVTGAREGQIQTRQAVGNVEREVAQTSHITEKWFAVDSNFRKRAMTKFLEVCKYAYKSNPKRAQFLLDDMGMVMVQHFDEFNSSQMDIHIANSVEDTALREDIITLSQAAIQNGQAKLEDIIAVRSSESVQETARKFKESAENIRREVLESQKLDRESAERIQQMKNEEEKLKRDNENYNKEEDRKVKYAEIEQRREESFLKEGTKSIIESNRIDSDKNGINDELDFRRTDIDENFKNETLDIKREELNETKRSNLANEKLKKEQISKTKNEKK